MILTEEEFKVLLMLYAANIDGSICLDEVEVMLDKSCPDSVKKIKKVFSIMSDMEVLECICENKSKYAATEPSRIVMMRDLRDIIEADEKVTPMEEQLLRIMQRLLKS